MVEWAAAFNLPPDHFVKGLRTMHRASEVCEWSCVCVCVLGGGGGGYLVYGLGAWTVRRALCSSPACTYTHSHARSQIAQALVNANSAFIASIIQKYYLTGVDSSDLYQEGVAGFLKCVAASSFFSFFFLQIVLLVVRGASESIASCMWVLSQTTNHPSAINPSPLSTTHMWVLSWTANHPSAND